MLDDAEQRIFDLANQKSKSSAKPVADVLKDTLAYLEDIRGKKYGITGVPSGLQVDQMTAGWQKGDLVIIAARPSMGKTAFVLTAETLEILQRCTMMKALKQMWPYSHLRCQINLWFNVC